MWQPAVPTNASGGTILNMPENLEVQSQVD